MRVLGLRIPFTRGKAAASLAPVDNRGGWFPLIREGFTGAWQQNVEVKYDSVLANHADFAVRTLIAADIGKLRIKLVQKQDRIWQETTNPAYSPVLRKPNRYQTRQQFIECWVLSKLQRGNTYVLKERDARNVVVRLYVLDPDRVKVLVADDGSIYYGLMRDSLSGLSEDYILVPASEIIHDRFNCFFHPLVGLSPIFANGLAATQGLAIQNMSAGFFRNGATPGGILTAPGAIGDDTAKRLKEHWEANYSGKNRGRIAVLGDGLKYEAMTAKAVDSQLIEQLKWTAEVICSTYHVPPYKIGVGAMPSYNNIQALNVEYYSQCLQAHIEAIEACLDEGLGMDGVSIGTEFDTDNLLRMDSVTQMEVLDKGKNTFTPNEARQKLDLAPKTGGDAVYRQQQDYSIEALAKRDAQDDPFGTAAKPAPASDGPPPANDNPPAVSAAYFGSRLRKSLAKP
ncbi:phage portal protein [Enterovirga aerilata]|uniref:Phage portal protein n=1 Tax=Enterovirga aerilata TaxID=2730920 RepID=A0A849IGG6_9HYPH|nr:phage portal protein [Enterovirga sp. DB1703]NNM75047.1 phage portal protein [Enterovirga sp. DB1703]